MASTYERNTALTSFVSAFLSYKKAHEELLQKIEAGSITKEKAKTELDIDIELAKNLDIATDIYTISRSITKYLSHIAYFTYKDDIMATYGTKKPENDKKGNYSFEQFIEYVEKIGKQTDKEDGPKI